jgi:hypothetical protein
MATRFYIVVLEQLASADSRPGQDEANVVWFLVCFCAKIDYY